MDNNQRRKYYPKYIKDHPNERPKYRYKIVERIQTENGPVINMLSEKQIEMIQLEEERLTSVKRRLIPDYPTLAQIRTAATIGMTDKEFAACFNVSLSCWMQFKKEWPQVREAIELGEAQGMTSIRKKQFDKAVDEGNVDMLKHLGKHRLGQHDKAQVEITPSTSFWNMVDQVSQKTIDVEAESTQVIEDKDL